MRVRLEWTGSEKDSSAFVGFLDAMGVKIVDRNVKELTSNRSKHNVTIDVTNFEVETPEPVVEVREKVVEKVKVVRESGGNQHNLPNNLYLIFHHNRPVLIVKGEREAEETVGALRAEQCMIYQRVGYEALPFNLPPHKAVEYLEINRIGQEKWDAR